MPGTKRAKVTLEVGMASFMVLEEHIMVTTCDLQTKLITQAWTLAMHNSVAFRCSRFLKTRNGWDSTCAETKTNTGSETNRTSKELPSSSEQRRKSAVRSPLKTASGRVRVCRATTLTTSTRAASSSFSAKTRLKRCDSRRRRCAMSSLN